MGHRFPCDLDEPIILMTIDPGTDTLGVSVSSLDLQTFKLTLLDGLTLQSSKALRLKQSLKDVEELKGGRTARLEYQNKKLLSLLVNYQPTFVGCESPFLGRMPQAFEALVECVCSIKDAVKQYDSTLVVEMIAPTAAKRAVGVKPRGTTKDDIRNAILKMVEDDSSNVEVGTEPMDKLIFTLDEHSMDAIAVGIYLANSIIHQFDI